MKDRIKKIRQDAGVTQAEFAESLGLSRIMVAHVETEKAIFSDRSMKDICRIYGVNEDWLRTGEGEPYAPKSRNEIIAEFLNSVMEDEPESVRRRWIEAFASLPDETWRAFDSLACEYVKRKEEG